MRPARATFWIISIFFLMLVVSCQTVDEQSTSTSTATNFAEKTPTLEAPEEEKDKEGFDPAEEDIIPKGLEILFWHPWAGETAVTVDALISDFNKKNSWSIKVESVPHADEDVLISDVTNAFSANEQTPDLIVSTSQSLQNWYSGGQPITALDTLIENDLNHTIGEILPELLPVFWNVDVTDGIRIGVPAYQSGHFLFYNKSWGSELGFDQYPKTIEDFREQSCAAARNNLYDNDRENNGTGGWIFNNTGITILSWLKSFNGGDLINSRSQPILTELENEEALAFLYTLYLQDCSWTGKESNPYGYFSNRMALFYSGTMEDLIRQNRYDVLNEKDDEWVLIPYPSLSGKPTIIVEGTSFAVTSENPDKARAAWELIKWMLQAEQQKRFLATTGTFPLSSEVIEAINIEPDFQEVWRESLQYLPFAQTEPTFPEWYVLEKILSDAGWQLIQFNMRSEDIPDILKEAETITREMREE
jgi:ABC-type glycerol-3-phosphate transport system substrate-binding protein